MCAVNMFSLMNRALESSSSHPDTILYLTSVKNLRSVRAENSSAIVEKIKDLLSTSNTKLQGLKFLEFALQQNSDIYLKGRWGVLLSDILKNTGSSVLKEHACKVLSMLIPYIAKDATANSADLQRFSTILFPFLLKQVEDNVEWMESACICLSTCLQCFPQSLESHKDRLFDVIRKQISCCVSSKTFEVFAECFSLIPSCMRNTDPRVYVENWTKQYLRTLNTMHYLLNTFLTFLTEEDSNTPFTIPDIRVFFFDDDEEESEDNVYPAYMKGVRRFINLSKCLAKMLSTKTKFAVQIPCKLTLECISRLFQVQDMCKVKATTLEKQIVMSTICHMQLAGLVLLESLVLSFNLVPYSFIISQMMMFALQASRLPNISSESVSPLRHAVWKLLNVWVNHNGAKVSFDIVHQQSLIEELLNDISVENNTSQTSAIAAPSKSKKHLNTNTSKTIVNKSQQAVCIQALKTLENVLYTGASFINKKLIEEIFTKLLQIAIAINPQNDPPFPYDDERCRGHLYSVLLAITILSKTDQRDPIVSAAGIFKNALQDPSTKVTRVSHKAMAMCRLFLHPKKPPPVFKDLDEKQRRTNAPSVMIKFPGWSSEDDYVQNLPPIESVSNVSENLTPRIAQTFHNPNEDEMQSDEYMQVDAHYSEQASESQCNGEDILEIQNSSQCHEEDSEDEDEEEDDERSYGEEEMNQEVDMQPENMYIPSTSKMQVLNPVHIIPDREQNITEQEYEELRPRIKTDGNAVDSSNKNMHLNGVRSIVPDEGMPSASTQIIANENGIYGFDEEDVEEEEEDEEEEEETFPAEKKVPDLYETPAKKQKLDNEIKEEPQDDERERSKSPTLVEMKADFCCNEVDDKS